MSDTIPLDEQIVATLTLDCASTAASSVLVDAKRLLADLTKQADAADVASLSPLATAAEARERRREAEDCRFDADRMEASVSALEARVSELIGNERREAASKACAAAVAERDALAADIAERYPKIVADLTDLAKRIAESDERCQRLHIHESAEAIGRGVPSNFVVHTGNIHRIQRIQIGMPSTAFPAWDAGIEGWRWHGLTAVSIADAHL